MMSFLKKKNCAGLTGTLFLLLLLTPLVQVDPWGRILISILVTLTFFGGICAVSDKRRHVLVAFLLMIPAVLVEWYTGAFDAEQNHLLLVPSLYNLPLYIFLISLILRYIFISQQIKLDHLFGAISVYMLIGLTFSHLYVIIERLYPGSFNLGDPAFINSKYLFMDLNYYSFVTLTSLGFGDMQPLSMWARSFTVVEAVVGVFYVGALVAHIAGSTHLVQPPRANASGRER